MHDRPILKKCHKEDYKTKLDKQTKNKWINLLVKSVLKLLVHSADMPY